MAEAGSFISLKMLILVMMASWIEAENFTRAFYPCLKPTEKLRNGTTHLMLPLELKDIISAKVSKLERYVVPLRTANESCEYIQKKVTGIFKLDDVRMVLEKSRLLGNASSNATISLHVLSLLSVEYLIANVVEIRRRYCRDQNELFDEERFLCYNPRHEDEETDSRKYKVEAIRLVAVAGNAISIIGQLLFFIFLFRMKSLHAPRKCIIFLAATQGLLHILQVASLYLYNVIQACTVIAISSHWVDLSAFVWLCCTSYEINWIISRKSSFTKQERFTGYSSFAFGLTAVIVLSCTITHFSSVDAIGYGQQKYCFIGNKWSLLYSFILPISIAFLVGAAWTVHNYRLLVTSPKGRHLRDSDPESLVAARLSVAIRITLLSLTILFIRLLDAFWRPSEIAILISKILISLQGVAICIGIGASRDFLNSFKSSIHRKQKDRLTYAYKYRQRINFQNHSLGRSETCC